MKLSSGITLQSSKRAKLSKYERPSSPGSLRPNQIITSYGPGSIFQTEHDSVIIMGLHTWFRKQLKLIHHPVLEGSTGKKGFCMPVQLDRKEVIPCKSFPLWGVCSDKYCRRLQKHDDVPNADSEGFRCVENKCKHSPLIHARFITMCDSGHLSEFPWERWAHHKSEFKNTKHGHCGNPKLFFKSGAKDPGISDYFVQCKNCKNRVSVASALGTPPFSGLRSLENDNFKLKCEGRRPWLDRDFEDVQDCDNQPYGVQTRATNVFFPVISSAIFVAKWVNEAQRIIREHSDTIADNLESGFTPLDLAEKMLFFKRLTEPEPEKWNHQKIADEIKKWSNARTKKYQRQTEREVKEDEYGDLESTDEYDDEEFAISKVDLNDPYGYISKLKKVSRLTEIKILRTFTRGQAPDPFSNDRKNQNYCDLGPKPKNEEERKWWNWLPGVENRGEGIFFTLNEEKLQKFDNDHDVLKRFAPIKISFKQWTQEREWEIEEEFSPRYVLLHTLAHLLIRELSASAGYGAASIRERIYHSATTNGILLFTASTSSDGSLGGLVRQGESERFTSLLKRAVVSSRRCSRDPLCMEDDPAAKLEAKMLPITRINGSACYACALLPETSCENSNRLLDRQFVSNQNFGFFKELL